MEATENRMTFLTFFFCTRAEIKTTFQSLSQACKKHDENRHHALTWFHPTRDLDGKNRVKWADLSYAAVYFSDRF